MMKGIAVCQKGFTGLTVSELTGLRSLKVLEEKECSVLFSGEYRGVSVFPHWIGNDVVSFEGESVNAIAGALFDQFFAMMKTRQITERWYGVFLDSQREAGLSRRASSIKSAFLSILKKRMSRVAKLLIHEELPPPGKYQGLFVFIDDFNQGYVSLDFIYNGQKRMSDDPLAPSRSYLKVEEGYQILRHEPQSGDLVVDLGAAPGGWSYSAAKRGATVYAVDNGPLKGGAKESDTIIHLKTDAFKYLPDNKSDWLFCDMVEEPHHVMKLLEQWIAVKRCRFFVINLKFGHTDPVRLIEEIESGAGGFKDKTVSYTMLHLYHDRDEFTITGTVY